MVGVGMEFIDISKWNGVFDWSKAVAKGIDGAYLKATGTGRVRSTGRVTIKMLVKAKTLK